MLFQKKLVMMTCLSTTLLLSACGGGTTEQVIDSITPPGLEEGPGGRFYGYYLQTQNTVDPLSNVGGLYLTLPSSGGNFSGRMSFQFLACQRTNALSISGEKVLSQLKVGTITGSLDSISLENLNPIFNGFFSGSYSRAGDNYHGEYNRNLVSGEDIKTTDCGNYTVADKGSWQVYKADKSFPSTFSVTQTGDLINWSYVDKATKALIMIINQDQVDSGNNAIIRQIITPAATLNTLAATNVTRGVPYLAVVELFDAESKPIAFKTLEVKF